MRAAVGLALLVAVATLLPARADAPAQSATVTAGANDTSGEATVGAGEHLLVRLTVSGGTGYSWKLATEVLPELVLSDQRMERSAARLGAPQLAVFDFDAQAAGRKELTFSLFAPGASDETAPAKTYVLTVTVSE
jgi:predicted secreted protein